MANSEMGSGQDAVISVGEYLSRLRKHVQDHGRYCVEGELSEHVARRGHWYFTIADESSSLKCVMWQSRVRLVGFTPEPGQLLRVYGAPTVYPKYCKLQFDVLKIERRHTTGELQKRFLELKQKLAQEGLFDQSAKLALPRIPKRIGIATSAEGAALQDMLRILRDRFPIGKVILAPVRVQGPGAAPEIATAIHDFNRLNQNKRPDLVIIGRGGGSLEDLWAFNEEVVAHAIYNSKIPIISAVGHETDTTIADLAADLRAATPTHAAQTAVPEQAMLIREIQEYEQQMYRVLETQTASMRRRIVQITESYTFNMPINHVRDAQQTLAKQTDLLYEACNARLLSHRHRIELLKEQIIGLNPNQVLLRGYARVERDREVVRSSRELNKDDHLSIHFADGHREAIVKD